jgi:hypothetical protein
VRRTAIFRRKQNSSRSLPAPKKAVKKLKPNFVFSSTWIPHFGNRWAITVISSRDIRLT